MRLNKIQYKKRLCESNDANFVFVTNFSNFWNPDDGENENEEDGLGSSVGRDGVLFLVDAGTVANDEEQFRNCLGLIETTMLNRIIQSEKDLVMFPGFRKRFV